MSSSTLQKPTLYVSGLDHQVSEQTLHDAFIPFGEILSVSLPKPELKSSTDPHRGFGYVEFSLLEDAREAMDNMDQAELYGRVIKVSPAKAQKEVGEGLGSRTAVWEQEGYAAKYSITDEDRGAAAAADGEGELNDGPADPMQGLEGLDEAGPRLQ